MPLQRDIMSADIISCQQADMTLRGMRMIFSGNCLLRRRKSARYNVCRHYIMSVPAFQYHFIVFRYIQRNRCYCSHAADKAAYERAGYGPHRDPLKPAQGSALMCAQVINLAVGDDLRASRSESASLWGPYSALSFAVGLRQPWTVTSNFLNFSANPITDFHKEKSMVK